MLNLISAKKGQKKAYLQNLLKSITQWPKNVIYILSVLTYVHSTMFFSSFFLFHFSIFFKYSNLLTFFRGFQQIFLFICEMLLLAHCLGVSFQGFLFIFFNFCQNILYLYTFFYFISTKHRFLSENTIVFPEKIERNNE